MTGLLACPTRDQVRDLAPCTKCGAVLGEECREGARSRDANHKVRYDAAAEILKDRRRRMPEPEPEKPEPSIDDFRRHPWS